MRILLSSIVLSLLLGGFLTACDSNPVEDDHEDHAEEIEGLRLVADGQTLASWTEDEGLSGSVTVSEGAETSVITVEFLDHEGDEVHAEDLSDEFGLDYAIDDEGVVEVVRPADAGRWGFTLRGIRAGKTTIDVILTHVDHPELTGFDIPVIVTEAE